MANSTLAYRATDRSGSALLHYAIWTGTLFTLNAVLLVFFCYVVPRMRHRYMEMKSPVPFATQVVLALSSGYANGGGWMLAAALVFLLAVPLAYFTAWIGSESLRRRRVKMLMLLLAGSVALFLVFAGVALWLPLLA